MNNTKALICFVKILKYFHKLKKEMPAVNSCVRAKEKKRKKEKKKKQKLEQESKFHLTHYAQTYSSQVILKRSI